MSDELDPGRPPRRPSLALLAVAVGATAATLAIVRLVLAGGTRIRVGITIDRPVDEVFTFVSDARNVLEWLPVAIERRKITHGPIGVGTKFEGTDRMGSTALAHTQEIIDFVPGRRVTTRISAPWGGDYEIRVEPVSDGTVLSVDATYEPSGWYRLFNLVPASLMERAFERDYARLKALLEARRESVAIPIEPAAEPADAFTEQSTAPSSE